MSSYALTLPTDAPAMAHALLEAAMAAGYAPSVHNRQPWRWRLAGNTLDLYLERGRMVDVADPDGRLATLSCGVALHHARMALAAHGWDVAVIRMPDDDADHMARLRVDGRAPVDLPSVLHLRTIPLRYPDRRVTGAPLGPDELEAVTTAVESEDTWLHRLNPDEVVDLTDAAEHGPAWRSDLVYRTKPTRPRIARSTMPARTAGPARITAPAPRAGLSINADLSIGADHDRSAEFVLLYGPTDEPADWLAAGEALSAGWLTATEYGVSVLPHSAPTEVRSTRQAMREMLADTGYPYLVLRLGTIDPADPGHQHTPRLPLDQLIERP